MSARIAIVGAGATALYCLKFLLDSPAPLSITIFESDTTFGRGMPYQSGLNAEYMLCNAFSREIPTVTQTLLQWLKGLPPRELSEWELSEHDLSARAFYPRVLIGDFLEHEFCQLCQLGERLGHKITKKPETTVKDIMFASSHVEVETEKHGRTRFDHVIITTGHSWPVAPKIDQATLISPWPYTNITSLTPQDIGILGSSLSAIDVALALGFTHGTFESSNGGLSWRPNDPDQPFKITMLSKMGIMPEGDFYYPFPYQPLKIFSAEAVRAEVSLGSEDLLARVFTLLCKELQATDPVYFRSLGHSARTIDGLSKEYFKARQRMGGLEAVKNDFKRVRTSMREHETIPYRYVLLRAHENFDLALRALNTKDWDEFQSKLLPVFADCYAAVPHLSIARIIALHNAGVLDIKETGEKTRFRNVLNGGVEVSLGGERLLFDVMIDSRGQAASPLGTLPFSSLVRDLADESGFLMAPFALQSSVPTTATVHCLSMPQLLERHPFSQGLADCANKARIVVDDLLARIGSKTSRVGDLLHKTLSQQIQPPTNFADV